MRSSSSVAAGGTGVLMASCNISLTVGRQRVQHLVGFLDLFGSYSMDIDLEQLLGGCVGIITSGSLLMGFMVELDWGMF